MTWKAYAGLVCIAAVFAFAGSFCATLLMPPRIASADSDVVVARELRIVDGNGKVRAALGVTADQTAKLGFLDTQGRPSGAVGAPVEGRQGITFYSARGDSRAELTMDEQTPSALHLKDATVKVGLSWPSLAKALGREADPRRWAVLYLGAAEEARAAPQREVTLLDGKGHLLPDQDHAMKDIEGIVVLDGTWSQAKTLWWRNPWVLKAKRLVLQPKRPSRYGSLRREPRREGLSTLEAAALALSRIEGRPEIEAEMIGGFEKLLARYRTLLQAQHAAASAPASPEQ